MTAPAWNLKFVPRPLRFGVRVATGAVSSWLDANGPQLGASIAFYTVFALAPLLVVSISIAGAVFGLDAARGQIVGQLRGLMGPTAAAAVEQALVAAWQSPRSGVAAAIAVLTMLIGATGVFAELSRALNAIGALEPRASAIGAFVRVRLIAFALMLGCGFVAIASLLASASIAALGGLLSPRLEGFAVLAQVLDVLLSVGLLSLAFAALLYWLPSRPPSRRGLWLSAVASGVLFTIGKSLIGAYLGRVSTASSFGAAGSFVVLLLWVYYSAQLLLLGASLGRSYDRLLQADCAPLPGGVAATGEAAARAQ